MKINTAAILKTMNGDPIKNEKGQDLTLGMVCVEAALGTAKGEENLSGEAKVTRYDLALAIHAADESIDLKAAQITLLKAQIAKLFTTLVVGQAWKMIEPDPVAGD